MSVLLGFLLLVLAGLVTGHFWMRIRAGDAVPPRRTFLRWMARSLAIPGAAWFFLNLGIFETIPPLIPELAVRTKVSWGLYFEKCLPMIVLAASWWSGFTMAWLYAEAMRRTTEKSEAAALAGLWGLLTLPVTGMILLGTGWFGLGLAVSAAFVPILHFAAPLCVPKPNLPIYSRAVAKLKFGKYNEAESEVIRQLERAEEDYEGWMLLAELYATRYRELKEADETVWSLVHQPNLSPLQISLALHRLADWHLEIGADPESAREALELLIQKLPGTHFARMAEQRLRQMPRTREDLQDEKRPKIISLPALSESALDESQATALSREEAVAWANRLVAKLTEDPDKIADREQLATLLAGPLHNPREAVSQIELLLDMPGQPEIKRAGWLALTAAWQARLLHDPANSRRTLERIVSEHPNTPQALAAQRRLNLLDEEALLARRAEAGEKHPPAPVLRLRVERPPDGGKAPSEHGISNH